MPAVMQALHKIHNDNAGSNAIEFEPREQFMSPAETNEWFKAWTGNVDADGSPFRIFGQDGSGGYAAFWLVREGRDVLQQPIVFLGSEGEMGVIAQSFSDYLWLLANNCGPCEAISNRGEGFIANQGFLEFAQRHAVTPASQPEAIIAKAKAEFPDFEHHINSLCQ